MPIQNPLFERVYNQPDVTVTVNGVRIQGFAEGASVTVRPMGGEVQLTEGLDGPGINRATRQGGQIVLNLRESSPGNAIMQALRLQQDAAPVGAIVVVSTGVGAIETLSNALVSLPGDLATGDKKMGARTYTLTGTLLLYTPPVLVQ